MGKLGLYVLPNGKRVAVGRNRTVSRSVAAAGGGGGGSITVTPFSRDLLIYDSGAAAGFDYATIPVSGTGPVGEIIEARAVSTALSNEGTTGWTAIGAASGAGNYSGTIDVPLARPWLKLETRIQSAPATTAQTTNRFAVGHVFANWGQSESARGWDIAFNDVAIPALVTLKQQVQNLTQPGMSGRTSRNVLNVAAPGNLPVGASISTPSHVIRFTSNQTVVDWSFVDFQVEINSGVTVTFNECQFSVSDGTPAGFMLYARNGGRGFVHDCTFEGSRTQSGLAAAIKEERGSTSNYGKIIATRCRITGLPSDGLKLVAGSIRWSYLHWDRNLDQIPVIWNAGTTYAAGDHVINDTGHVYKSKAAGNIGNQPPSGKVTTDPNWTLVDPHVDSITVEHVNESVFIEYCYIDMSDMTLANGGTGSNNYVRFQPNTGTTDLNEAHVRFCILDRDPTEASSPFQVTAEFLGQVFLYGNWYRPKNGTGTSSDIVNAELDKVHWSGMRHIDTDAIRPAPIGTNDEDASFVDETTDDVIQHVYHDRVSAGAAGVKHKSMTAASRHSPAFAAMANISLMEMVGYKVCWVHHTISGTGFVELFSDANTVRNWADEQALHDYATVDGGSVGLVCSSWYAAPTAFKNVYGHTIYEMFAKKRWGDGSAIVATPYGYPSTGAVASADHFWGDLYSAARTRWAILGPHVRMAAENMLNSTRTIANARQFTMENYAIYRQTIRAQLADTRVNGFLTQPGLEPINWETGALNSGFSDWLHPSADTIDGLAQYLGMLAHGALQSAGIRKWTVPEFDQVFWASDGSYVEVWSSAGDVTTTRLNRGLGSIGVTHPHWTDVFGWEWKVGAPNWGSNGDAALVPVQDAIIVSADGSGTPASVGRVRITKPGGGIWSVGDTVAFGGGAGSGQIVHPDDGNARCWMNCPIVMVGAYGADGNQAGMSLRPAVSFTRP